MTNKYAGYPVGVAIALAISSATTYSSTARALDAATAEGDTSLDKVTVTARRREEKAQDVPLAISVSDGPVGELPAAVEIACSRPSIPSHAVPALPDFGPCQAPWTNICSWSPPRPADC